MDVFEKTRHLRKAQLEDIPNLREVAAFCVNPYDRVHADPCFSNDEASAYMATYVEEAVKGFTDITLVPDDNAPANAFVCGNLYPSLPWGFIWGRLVFTAVKSPERKGWYEPLNTGLLHWLREQKAEYCLNTTQATNRAVIHVCEKTGYRFGYARLVFSFSGP